jgi:molybdenum cofactor guanylyltransferase
MMVPRMHSPVAAAILAGGRARRFNGRDKSRLLVEGRPIINRQLEILQQLTSEIFVVSGDALRFADLGIPAYQDVIPGAGALGGIYTSLEIAAADLVVTVACDLPFLDAGLLGRLVALAAGHDGAWVRTVRGPEPLLACYQRAARQRIRAEIEGGRFKAADLGSALNLAELGETDVARFGPVDRLLANINTPDDYERLKA